jgi:EpsI family protein
MFRFLSTTPARILTLFLILQGVAYYALARTEPVRVVNPLTGFPQLLGSWHMVHEGVIEQEVLDVLKADEVITRWYESPQEKAAAGLFIAYFTTQRTGKAPHSPKNCLPGSGWMPVVNDKITIDIPGRQVPVEANRYVVARGEARSLVIYWYQTHRRTVASEYTAKAYTVLDSLRYNRSDTAIVKVTLNVPNGDFEAATEVARRFVRSFFDQLTPYFPA